jgi:c-di-GMP phosphodiesterase
LDLFIARQPIFDTAGNVAGYELLYRRSADSRFADGSDTRQMSVDVVAQSFLEVGLERITRGKPGFLNFDREMLLSRSYDLLPPESLVVELLETVEVDGKVREACERMHRIGYRLALDDFQPGGAHEELLDLASIVKVDVLNKDPEFVAEIAATLRGRGVRILAEKVETAEVHETCKKLGFELFQGYFYSKPEIVANQGASVGQLTIIKLMNLLGSEHATDQDVEEAFRRDPSLSYKLLRMLNTAAQGRRGVDSIRYAIRLLGRGTLQRWLSLLLASSFVKGGETDVELVNTAVQRARFCELLGLRAKRWPTSDPLFLLGLFSLMDSLLRIPMGEVLDRVDLSDPVRDALLRGAGPYADFLALAQAYESGDWDAVTEHAPRAGLAAVDVPDVYLDALYWSREQLSVAA